MFRQSGSFFVIAVCNAVAFGCDSLIIISMLGAQAAGEPLIALRLLAALQALMAGMVIPYWPRLSRAGSVLDRKRAVQETLAFILLISAGAAGTLLLFGPAIVKLWTAGAAELPAAFGVPIAAWIFVFGLAQGLLTIFSVEHLVRIQLAVSVVSGVLVPLCKIGGVMLWGAPGLVWGGTVALIGAVVIPMAAVLARDLRLREP
jgi:O-antigen/teichoic acid export membrane protein